MAYEKFMHNKYYHPASIQNIKKVWEAEQRKNQDEKKQEELRQQCLKEQEIYQNKEQLGKAHPLSFMYDPPPGYDKQQDGSEIDDLLAEFSKRKRRKILRKLAKMKDSDSEEESKPMKKKQKKESCQSHKHKH